MGQQVTSLSLDQIDAAPTQLNVSQLTGGFYYLQVIVDGELKDMQKVVVKKR